MDRLYRVIDTAIVIICLPFYAVATSIMLFERWLRQRRKLVVGLEVSHYPCHDVRQELRVVDLSRLDVGLVGVRHRTWARETVGTPPWSESVAFIDRTQFWNPPLDGVAGLEPA